MFTVHDIWLGVLAAVVSGLVAAAAVGLSALGRARWRTAARLLVQRLESGRELSGRLLHDEQDLHGLPVPVRRYFRAALREGQPVIAAATIEMAGTINLSPDGQRWKPFTSRQRVLTGRPGFVWNACVSLLPGLAVRVVDSYVLGEGLLKARVQGLLTVADQHGGGDIARGELMRYFAEMPWYPTALLPGHGVRWTAVDDHSADATLGEGAGALTLRFGFGDDGLIESFRAESRGSLSGSQLVMAPWEGRFSDYRYCQGMRVPFAGEVAWVRPEGRHEYFKCRVVRMRYEFAAPARWSMAAHRATRAAAPR